MATVASGNRAKIRGFGVQVVVRRGGEFRGRDELWVAGVEIGCRGMAVEYKGDDDGWGGAVRGGREEMEQIGEEG